MKKALMISLVAMAITSLAALDVLARGGGGGGGGRGGSSRGGMQSGGMRGGQGGSGTCGGSMQQMQQMQRMMMQNRYRYGQGNCQNGASAGTQQQQLLPNSNRMVNPVVQAQYQQWLLQNQAALQAQQAQRANRSAQRRSRSR